MKSNFFIAPLIAVASYLGVGSAHSQTLNWASLTGSEIVDSQGAAIDPNTFVFELGAFNQGFVPTATNVGGWVENWHVFDTAMYGYTDENGWQFNATVPNVAAVPAYAEMFQGLEAYIFVRNAAGTEFFLADPVSGAAWVFPIANTGCCPNGAVATWSLSNLGPDAPIWGSQNGVSGGGTGTPGGYDLQTYTVPEWNSFCLVLLGASVALMRRRRAVG